MAAKIHPAATAGQRVMANPPGRHLLSFLTLADQRATLVVSKAWKNQTTLALQNDLVLRTPEGVFRVDIRTLPIRLIPNADQNALRAQLATFPDHAVGWIQVAHSVWTLFSFDRFPSNDKSLLHTRLCYLSRLPDNLDGPRGVDNNYDTASQFKMRELTDKQVEQLPKEKVKWKVGFWDIKERHWPKSILWQDACCCFACCCRDWCSENFCFGPWDCWFNCCCSSSTTLDVEENHRQTGRNDFNRGTEHSPNFYSDDFHYFPIFSRVNYYDLRDRMRDSFAIRFAVLRYDTNERPITYGQAENVQPRRARELSVVSQSESTPRSSESRERTDVPRSSESRRDLNENKS
jgi:hypothetical protein